MEARQTADSLHRTRSMRQVRKIALDVWGLSTERRCEARRRERTPALNGDAARRRLYNLVLTLPKLPTKPDKMKCCTCDGQRMIPSDDPNGDVMNTPCPECNEHSPSYDKAAHDKAWEKNFVLPLGREMKKRGIRYMVMILRDDGKLAYTLDTKIPGENA